MLRWVHLLIIFRKRNQILAQKSVYKIKCSIWSDLCMVSLRVYIVEVIVIQVKYADKVKVCHFQDLIGISVTPINRDMQSIYQSSRNFPLCSFQNMLETFSNLLWTYSTNEIRLSTTKPSNSLDYHLSTKILFRIKDH